MTIDESFLSVTSTHSLPGLPLSCDPLGPGCPGHSCPSPLCPGLLTTPAGQGPPALRGAEQECSALSAL